MRRLPSFKKRMTVFMCGILAVSAAGFLAGCGGLQEVSSAIHGQVKIAGSTTVLPLAQEAATEFMSANPKTDVEVQGGGSSAGITQLKQKVIDIANSSRDLQPGENTGTFVDHKIAFDIIAIIVNPSNNIRNLTKAQARAVFSGAVTNWKQLGGPDKEIVVVVRDQASGTREVFDQRVLGGTAEKPVPSVASAIESSSNGVVREIVASTPSAIGYVSYGYINSTVRAVDLDRISPDIPNAASGRYPLARYLHMFTSGAAEGPVKAYIDFVLSDKFQDEVVKQEYVRMKDVLKQ
jgi:phosphate transport system substrate-binding protein